MRAWIRLTNQAFHPDMSTIAATNSAVEAVTAADVSRTSTSGIRRIAPASGPAPHTIFKAPQGVPADG